MNIFIGNLASTVTTDDLRMAFSGFGTVINVIVVEDPATGEPRGHAHVYLVPEHAAHRAIVALDQVLLRGKPMAVRECIFRTERDRRATRASWPDTERRLGPERRHGNQQYGTGAQRAVQNS